MQNYGAFVSHYGVENHGIKNAETVYWNLTTSMLYELSLIHISEPTRPY